MTHHHYRHRDTGVVVALTTAERARWFDNRDPSDWLHTHDVPALTVYEPYPGAFDHILGPETPRPVAAFVTDEMEGRE